MFNKINLNCRQLPSLPSVKSVRQFYVLRLTRRLQMLEGLVSTSAASIVTFKSTKTALEKLLFQALDSGFHDEWVMSDFPRAKENICSRGFLAENLVNANLSSFLCCRSYCDVCLHQAVTNFSWRTGRKIIEKGIRAVSREKYSMFAKQRCDQSGSYVYLGDQRGSKNTDYCTDESRIYWNFNRFRTA